MITAKEVFDRVEEVCQNPQLNKTDLILKIATLVAQIDHVLKSPKRQEVKIVN